MRKNSRITLLIAILCMTLATSSTFLFACGDKSDEHTWGEWTVVTEPTCTENGEEKRICADPDCNETESREIPAKGHTPSKKYFSDAEEHWHLCDDDGVKLDVGKHIFGDGTVCTVCSYAIPHSHTWGEWTTVTEPTCSLDGTERRVCTDPGCPNPDTAVETRPLAALGHESEGEWKHDSVFHWKDCGRCDEKAGYAEHRFDDNGTCLDCAYSRTETPALTYVLSSDETSYIVEGAGKFSGTALEIPSVYNGKPVTEIAARAFEQSALTSVVIPSNVTIVGPYAFAGCESLLSASLGGVDYIGDYAFRGCGDLMSVTVGGSLGYVGKFAFDDCHRLVEVFDLSGKIEKGSDKLGYIGYYALDIRPVAAYSSLTFTDDGFVFYVKGDARVLVGYVGNATEITLPAKFNDGNYTVNDMAISDKGITKVLGTGGATAIGNRAFGHCTSLTSAVVGEAVTSIGEAAFGYCTALETFTLGEGLAEIGERAFEYCKVLTAVKIPAKVATIGEYAFDGCGSIEKIDCSAFNAKPAGWDDYWNWYEAKTDGIVEWKSAGGDAQ